MAQEKVTGHARIEEDRRVQPQAVSSLYTPLTDAASQAEKKGIAWEK